VLGQRCNSGQGLGMAAQPGELPYSNDVRCHGLVKQL
jgi:hypothetical protein